MIPKPMSDRPEPSLAVLRAQGLAFLMLGVPAFALTWLLAPYWEMALDALRVPEALEAGIGMLAAVAATLAAQAVLLRSRHAPLRDLLGPAPNTSLVIDGRTMTCEEAEAAFAQVQADAERWRAHVAELERRTDGAAAAVGEVPSFCELADAHLKTVVGQTESAAFAILERLRDIDAQVTRFVDFLRRSDRDSAALLNTSGQSIARNRECIDGLQRYLEERLQDAMTDRNRFAEIIQVAEGLERSIGAISRILSATNMLALNATIEATRAGEYGHGFKVVAAEVRELSNQTSSAIKQVHEGISRMRRAIDQQITGQHIEEKVESERALLTGLTEQLVAMADGYRGVTDYQRSLLGELDMVGQEIARLMMNAMGQVQFQDIVRQQVDSVLAGLDGLRRFNVRLAAHLAEGGEETGKDLKAVFADMTGTYVTEVQWRRHDEVVNGSGARPAETLPAIELF